MKIYNKRINSSDLTQNQIEKLNKYTNNWKDYFNNKDFDGMQREYDKIRGKMKEIAPIENTITTARVVENLHKLIKNVVEIVNM